MSFGLKYNFSQSLRPRCLTPLLIAPQRSGPHGRGYVLPAYGLTRRSASWFLLFFEEQELTLGLVLFSHLGEETGVLVAGLGVACVQPDRFLK